MRRLLTITLSAFFALHSAFAADLGDSTTLPQITADHTEINDQSIIYTGNSTLTYGNITLTADKITFQHRQKIATATGNAILTQTNTRLLADSITYDIPSSSYTLQNLRAGQNPFYLSGTAALGNTTRLTLENATATYTDPSFYAPTLSAKKLTYDHSTETLETNSAWVGVGPIRPIPVPGFTQNITSIKALIEDTDLAFRLGFNSRFGAYLDATALLPVSATTHLGGSLGIYTKRGLLIGPGASYKTENIHSRILTAYIHDNGDLGTDIQNDPINKDRGFAMWQHQQLLAPNLTLNAQVNYWSDSEILRDYRRNQFTPVQTPDNFADLTYQQPAYTLNLFTRFQPNSYHIVQQRLPEIRFDLLPSQLLKLSPNTRLYQRLNLSAAYLKDNSLPDALTTDHTTRLDAYYALTLPMLHSDYLSFTPVAGGRLTYYDNVNNRSNYTRLLGEVGADLQLRTSATSDYQNKLWNINGLRHLLTPKLSYRYIPKADKGSQYIPPIDTDTFYTYLPTLGLADRRDIDTLQPTNTLRLALDNVFQTRDSAYGSRNLASLLIAADYHFSGTQQNQHDLSDLHIDLSLTPVYWFNFQIYQNLNPNRGTLNELGTALTIQDARKWQLRLSANYLNASYLSDHYLPTNRAIQEYLADFQYSINETYSLLFRLRFDAEQHRFTEQRYVLRQNLGNLWLLDYQLAFYSGDRRESRTSYSIRIHLLTR